MRRALDVIRDAWHMERLEVGPLVITTRQREIQNGRNAFELGRERHLRVVS